MKVAFISQGVDDVLPPRQNSVGLCTYSLSRHFPSYWDRVVYCAGGIRRQVVDHEGVRFVTLPVGIFDRALRKLQPRYSRAIARVIGGDRPKPFSASLCCYPLYMLRVARELRQERPAVIHIQHGFQFVPIMKLLNPRSKVVVQFQAAWTSQSSVASARRLLRYADGVAGASEFITEGLRREFPELHGRTFTLYDGVEPSEFTSKLQVPATSNIVFAGQVSPHKGVHDLIDAFILLAPEVPAATLTIVGPQGTIPLDEMVSCNDVETRRRLAPFYAKSGNGRRATPDYMAILRERIPSDLSHRISFTGHVTREELLAYIRNARVFAFPSVWDEGFGMPPVEAMASGTPVVGTRSGAVCETVEHGVTRFLVEKADVHELSRKLLLLLTDDALRSDMGAAARDHVLRTFSWTTIANQGSQIYCDLG